MQSLEPMRSALTATLLASVTTLLLVTQTSGAAPSTDATHRGLEIATAADRAGRGYGAERATLTMDLINSYGDVAKRKLTVDTLEGSGDGDRSKVVVLWPADVKGTKLLTWSHPSRDDDQWLYLPAIKRVRRISGSNKTGAFMGSEFAYEDLGATVLEKFTYKYVDEPKLDGRDANRLERSPVDKDSAYSRQVIWLDKQYQEPLRVEYYDCKNALLKVATFAGYHKLDRFWRAKTVTMENVQTRKKTILNFEDRQLHARLGTPDFDSGRLED
jgi:hypothetical protein